MRAHSCQMPKAQRGVAMVEFAISLPVLLLLLLAIGEFGRMLYQYNSLYQASRDAGRYVAGKAWNRTLGKIILVDPSLRIDLVKDAKNIALYGKPGTPSDPTPVVTGLTLNDVSVSAVDAEHIEVRIDFTFEPVIGNSIPALFGDRIALNIPLVATTVMRAL